ncbi:hypothetical protein QQP08_009616, partial [Theobroma cacao]
RFGPSISSLHNFNRPKQSPKSQAEILKGALPVLVSFPSLCSTFPSASRRRADSKAQSFSFPLNYLVEADKFFLSIFSMSHCFI